MTFSATWSSSAQSPLWGAGAGRSRLRKGVEWTVLLAVVVLLTPVVWFWGELPAGDADHADV